MSANASSGGQRRLPKAAPGQANGSTMRQTRLSKIGVPIALGFATGLAELAGYHAEDVGTVIVNNPWSASGIAAVGAATFAASRARREHFVSVLRRIATILEEKR